MGTFLGYVYSTPEDIVGRSSITELYRCHKCKHYTRFPRYNAASSIVKYKRGRCGEYSILLYRILRDLGHNTRWVVDWSDHVWVECWFGDCEELPVFAGRAASSSPSYSNITDREESRKPQAFSVPCGRWVPLDPCEAAVG